jgi:hypothetical protein
MTMCRRIVFVLALSAGSALAREPDLDVSAATTNSAAVVDETRLLAPLVEDSKRSQDVIVVKKVEIGGPLVRPFKVRKIREFPRRLLQLINLFAPLERKEELESTRGLSARAWSSVVGWNPGGSAFSDPMTHEASMGLISFSKGSKD